MKILIVKDVPGEINVQNMTYNIQEIGLAVALRKKGHECDVMSISDDGVFHEQHTIIEEQDITVYSVEGFVVFKNGWFKKNVYPILDRYDIIQACEYNQMFTRHLAKRYKDKMVCYHGPYYCKFNKNYNLMAKLFDLFFVKRYIKHNTPFITKSKLAADYLKRKGINNVTSMGVGLNTSFLSTKSDETTHEVESIKKLNGVKLLYIGVNEPRRNSLFLLDIMWKLKHKGLNFNFVIIGRFCNDEYKKEFFSKVERLGLSDKITYIPRLEQKYLSKVYKECDMFLLPTIYDIYGMVLLEAMYFGIPTITTVNGGSNMMIEDGKNGYVINEFDAKKWADLIYVTVNDKQKCMNIRACAHKTIVNNFTWDCLADRFIEVYQSRIAT